MNKLLLIMVLIGLSVCFTPTSLRAEKNQFKDLSVLVLSCDKYAELWDPFFTLLYRHWPELKTDNKDLPLYLIANSKRYNDPRVQMINIQNEKSWSDNMLFALDQIKSDYVLILLEDYYITAFDAQRLSQVYDYTKAHDGGYLQIYADYKTPPDREGLKVFPGVALKDKHELWRTSLQACIWRVKDLKHILKEGESPWEFEIAGSVRSEGSFSKYFIVFEQVPINYLNMTQGGYLNAHNLQRLKNMGVDFKPQTLKLDDDFKFKLWIDRTLMPFLYWDIWRPFKIWFKKIF